MKCYAAREHHSHLTGVLNFVRDQYRNVKTSPDELSFKVICFHLCLHMSSYVFGRKKYFKFQKRVSGFTLQLTIALPVHPSRHIQSPPSLAVEVDMSW